MSGLALAVDRQGAAYVAGYTYSWDFPTTPGAFQLTPGACEHDPCYDAYVAKVNPRGTGLEYATYLGGKSVEWARGITVGRKGEAYVTGMTASPDFPTTAELYGPQGRGAEDVFVVKLNATGTRLEYATRLGGSRTDMGVAIALGWWCRGWRQECPQGQDSDVRLAPEERAFLTGLTWSTDFPVTAGAMQGKCAPGCLDAFVVQLDARGERLVYATYLGGGGWESGLAIAVNGKEEAYIGGQSESGDLPGTAGGADSTYNGGNDGFILKLNATGTAAVYATYLGGSGYDLIAGLALGSGDQVYVTGITESRDLAATSGAFQTRFGGGVAFKSVDGGANWRPADRGLGNVRIRSFSIDPFTPTHLYAGDGQILFRSKDGGENWEGANWNNFLPTPVFDPQNPGVLCH